MILGDPERRALVESVRRVAAEEIMPRFRKLGSGQVSEKSGRYDLVTEADLRAEARLARIAQEVLPGAFVLGEEAVETDPALLPRLAEAELAVVIDPVDGTWNFANGLAVFGSIVAVTERGRAVWGMIHDPTSDTWIEASEGGGAWSVAADGSKRRLTLSREDAEIGTISGYAHAFQFAGDSRRTLFAALPGLRRCTSLRCSAWEYRMLAEGRGEDFALSPGLKPWDHLAGALAMREAGGVARTLRGADYDATVTEGPLLIARSEAVWSTLAAHFERL